ncbi:MAG: hypothetical protein KC414_12420, partial [Romboutsia sp.]|nr:hypothetical protein [Romboutsia sp.]
MTKKINEIAQEIKILEESAKQELLQYQLTDTTAIDLPRLISKSINISNLYKPTMSIPQVPTIYGNASGNPKKNRIDLGIPRHSVTVQLTTNTSINLPPQAKLILSQNNISLDKLECYISMQNQPWQDCEVLLVPHLWVYKNIASTANSYDIKVAVAEPRSFFGGLSAKTINYNDLSDGISNFQKNIVIKSLKSYQYNNLVYSICINKNDNKAVITLHCLLNDYNQSIVEKTIYDMTTNCKKLNFINFMEALEKNKVNIDLYEVKAFAYTPRNYKNELNYPITQIHIADTTYIDNNENIQNQIINLWLAENGFDINNLNKTSSISNSHAKKHTPLTLALYEKRFDLFKKLLERGAD